MPLSQTESEFDLHENELVGETHFHKNGFALRLVLTQRQTRTRKWAIALLLGIVVSKTEYDSSNTELTV